MKQKIKQIASVQVGYSFRSRIEPGKEGPISVIQMKDLENSFVNTNEFIKTDISDVKETYLIRKNDIIFRARGVTNTSAILKEEVGEGVVAAPLFRIRVTAENVLPDYVCWYINLPQSQKYLSSHAKGTAQKMIPRETLEDFEIEVPSLDCQQGVIEIAQLQQKELNLLQDLASKRKHFIDLILIKSVKETSS